MSKIVYAIFLVLGTMISSVYAEDRYYKTEEDLNSEEIKDVIKNNLQERLMRQFPQGNEKLAQSVSANLNKTLNNVFTSSEQIQDYISQCEAHQAKIDKAEQFHRDLQAVMTNATVYLADNDLSDEAYQKHMTALKEPLDVAKPIQEKLARYKEVLTAKQEKIDELLDQIERIIQDDDFKLKRKVQRKVLIFESTDTGETVSTECIADENDAIAKQKFYGSYGYDGLLGIELLLQSGKTFTCGTKDQSLLKEITQSDNLIKLRVNTQLPTSYHIYEIQFIHKNDQKKTTGSLNSGNLWKEYQVQPEEKLIGYLGSYFKFKKKKEIKSLYMVLESYEYY